jgi:hypothetical protein
MDAENRRNSGRVSSKAAATKQCCGGAQGGENEKIPVQPLTEE